MSKQALERKLESLDALCADPAGSIEPLRKALKDRNNYFVAKAAEIAGRSGLASLADDLAAAFDRFLIDGSKSDPQCWAKNAIAKALKDLNYDDARLFLRGMRHIQMEPVWPGPGGGPSRVDTAGTLRGACALALVGCAIPRLDVLRNLVDLLGSDELKSVRIDAARAIAQLAGPDSVLLLRLKALAGDLEPEVIGQCFLGLLDMSPGDYIPFVAAFLEKNDPDLRLEAAVALGECPREEAVEALAQAWGRLRDGESRRAILVSLGAARLESAAKFLLSVIADADLEDASHAIRALASGRFSVEYRQRTAEALRARGNAKLDSIFAKEFATS